MKKIIEEIRENSMSYGSIPFWSWNDKLEEKELRHQIQKMKELGMNGFFMHARGGLETEYLSDEWFDCINVCIDEAKKLGMEAWSYDENGWPSGFAGGKLLGEKENRVLDIRYTEGAYPTEDLENVLGVYTYNEDGSYTRVTSDVGADKYLTIFRHYNSSYVDILNPNVTDQFIALTHEEYKKRIDPKDWGTIMPGFFTDEPQYCRRGTAYTNMMPDAFREAYGYEIYDHLPALFFNYEGSDTFRHDYWYMMQKLFTTNFTKRIYDWCEENGSQLTGHGFQENSLYGQIEGCAGIMAQYEYEHIPGIDHLGREVHNDVPFKQIGSVCAQLGKKKAVSEMFGCCGWDVNPLELKRIAESQYAGGINIMCQHLYAYSERGQRKTDYPLHYSEHNPWTDYMGDFDKYFNNLGSTLSRGTEYAPILVIHPVHGAYCRFIKNTETHGEIEAKMIELSNYLGENQVPYHYGDEWMMERHAAVEGGKIRLGLCTYDAVVLPFTYSIDTHTAEMLKEFVDNGGKLYLWEGTPIYVDGRPQNGRLDWMRSTMSLDDVLAYRDAVISKDGKNVNQLRKMTRVTDEGNIVFITNITAADLENVKVELDSGNWAKLDMHTLDVLPVHTETEGDKTIVSLNFTESESYVLIQTEEEMVSVPEPKFASKFIPVPRVVNITEKPKNVITLDYAQISKDGVTFEETLPLVAIKDNLLFEHYNGTVYLKFSFDLEYVPGELNVIVEPMFQSVRVNGAEVFPTRDKWWFDKSFLGADIVPFVKKGKNEIVIEVNHYQRDHVYYVLYGGVTEGLRNCLAFDVEIENIYLTGDFAVRCDGEFKDVTLGDNSTIGAYTQGKVIPTVMRATVFDGKFTLVAQPSVVCASNVIRGGFPFYAGKIRTSFTYNYKAGDATILKLTGRFAVAEITVNGTYAGHMMFTREMDLADLLKEGENTIEISICNSMRNTLGPHHGNSPEGGVYPRLFSYECMWNGKKTCSSFHDTYSFVPFGIMK